MDYLSGIHRYAYKNIRPISSAAAQVYRYYRLLERKKTMSEFTHFDTEGSAVMVDVSEKAITTRCAIACGDIYVSEAILQAILEKKVQKGDVLSIAQIAGIMGAKKTADIIPLCHPLMLGKCSVTFTIVEDEHKIRAQAMVKTDGKTGVEMEALSAVSIALLTIYDMCKAIDKHMHIEHIHLVSKHGGKSGDFYYE